MQRLLMSKLTLFFCFLGLTAFANRDWKEVPATTSSVEYLEEQISLAAQGHLTYRAGDLYKLCDRAFEAVIVAQKRDDRITMARLWILIARALELERDFTTAIAAYEEAAWLYRNLRDKRRELDCIFRVMKIHYEQLQDLDATLEVVDKVLNQKNYLIENRLYDQMLFSYCKKGEIYAQKNKIDSSEYYLSKAVVFDEHYPTSNYALAYIPLINNILDRQDYYNAIYYSEQFTLKAQKDQHPENEMWSWNLQARLYADLGIYKKAETAFEQATRLAVQLNNFEQAKQFELKKLTAQYYQQQNDSTLFREIETLTQKLISSNSCLDDPSVLIDLYIDEGAFDIAVSLTDHYINCTRASQHLFHKGKAEAKKMTLLFHMGKYEAVSANAVATYQLAQQIQSPLLLADLEMILGQIEANKGNSEQAARFFQKAKRNSNKIESLKLQNVKLLTKRLSEQEKQLALLSKEKELLRLKQERTSIANILISLAFISLFIVFLLWRSRRKILISNQQIKYELNENIYLLAEELSTNKLQLSEATQQAINQQEDILSNWSEEVIQLSKADANPLLIGRQLGRLQNILKMRLQQQEEMMMNVRAVAAQKEEELKSFNYMVGHDLKMPLSTANNFVHILLNSKDKLDEDTLFYLYEFKKSLHEMDAMIDGINRYTKIDHIQLLEKEIELGQLIKLLVYRTKKTLPNVAKVHFEIANSFPIIKGDMLLIQQVLINLISNAVKFSAPTRKPAIKIYSQTQMNYHILKVEDNGVGIPDLKRKKIFELFQRAHEREEFEGTGVGLTIVQRIMQRHGGKVQVKSKVGIGTCISLFFPKS
ncbi:MAG: sensor histidine kinase [Bacteroidota bacterium]